jgi:hypothetical protein
MLIDRSMPDFEVRVRRERLVAAPCGRVGAAIFTTDLNKAFLLRALRPQTDWSQRWHHDVSGLRRPPFRLLDLRRFGFVVLEESPEKGIVLGVIARLWSVRPQPQRVPAEFYARYAKPGYVKIAMSFEVESVDCGTTRLICEIRFRPTDRLGRRRFWAGWPFGWLLVRFIQWEMLRLIGRQAIELNRRAPGES